MFLVWESPRGQHCDGKNNNIANEQMKACGDSDGNNLGNQASRPVLAGLLSKAVKLLPPTMPKEDYQVQCFQQHIWRSLRMNCVNLPHFYMQWKPNYACTPEPFAPDGLVWDREGRQYIGKCRPCTYSPFMQWAGRKSELRSLNNYWKRNQGPRWDLHSVYRSKGRATNILCIGTVLWMLADVYGSKGRSS